MDHPAITAAGPNAAAADRGIRRHPRGRRPQEAFVDPTRQAHLPKAGQTPTGLSVHSRSCKVLRSGKISPAWLLAAPSQPERRLCRIITLHPLCHGDQACIWTERQSCRNASYQVPAAVDFVFPFLARWALAPMPTAEWDPSQREKHRSSSRPLRCWPWPRVNSPSWHNRYADLSCLETRRAFTFGHKIHVGETQGLAAKTSRAACPIASAQRAIRRAKLRSHLTRLAQMKPNIYRCIKPLKQKDLRHPSENAKKQRESGCY